MESFNLLKKIFICGHRKSGTTLFQNIFDSHEEILTYPIDLNVLYAFYPKYILVDNFEKRNERLSKVIFEELRNRTDLKNLDLVEKDFFSLLGSKNNDIKFIINCLQNIWEKYFRLKNHKYFLLKETSIEIYLPELDNYFNNSIFICLIRDPRDNFASLKEGVDNYYSKIGEDHNMTLFSLLNRVGISFRFIKNFSDKFLNFHIYKFEDLTTNPKQTFLSISKILGISFKEHMLSPTVNGSITSGNNFMGAELTSISSLNTNNWKNRLNEEEIEIIEYYLKDLMTFFDYKCECIVNPQTISTWYKWMNYKYLFHDRFR